MQQDEVNMKAICTDSFNELTDAKARQRIVMKVQRLPNIQGDATLLKQVWVNLLSNAIKYSSKKEKTEISISSEQMSDKVIYSVKDNGAGFDMKYAKKLFGVFERLHGEEEFSGTGVGLAVVKRIIDRHHGEIWAESEVGQGAVFYFSLPKIQSAE
jgi:light-regulated signal transduction histidine kinase (bacteriophytochrome)